MVQTQLQSQSQSPPLPATIAAEVAAAAAAAANLQRLHAVCQTQQPSPCRPQDTSATGGNLSRDLLLLGPVDHGVKGLVHLLSIESPGMTASLALAEHCLSALDADVDLLS